MKILALKGVGYPAARVYTQPNVKPFAPKNCSKFLNSSLLNC